MRPIIMSIHIHTLRVILYNIILQLVIHIYTCTHIEGQHILRELLPADTVSYSPQGNLNRFAAIRRA